MVNAVAAKASETSASLPLSSFSCSFYRFSLRFFVAPRLICSLSVISSLVGFFVFLLYLPDTRPFQGATYSIVMAKVSNVPEDEPFHWKSYLVLLPWVSHCCDRPSDNQSTCILRGVRRQEKPIKLYFKVNLRTKRTLLRHVLIGSR